MQFDVAVNQVRLVLCLTQPPLSPLAVILRLRALAARLFTSVRFTTSLLLTN